MSADTYHFGPRDRRGVILGLTPSQVAGLALGAAGGLGAALGAHASLAGLAFVAAGAAWAFLPIAGRAPYDWAAPAASRLLGARAHRAALTSHRFGPRPGPGRERDVRATWRIPGAGRVLVETAACARGEVAIVRAGAQRRCFTVAVNGPRFGLAGALDQSMAISAWGTVLAASAGTAIRRLQVTESLAPDPAAAQLRWLAQTATPIDDKAGADYRSYLDEVRAAAVRHDVYLTAAVDVGRGSRASDEAAEHCGGLIERLEASGFSARPLGPAALAGALRAILDPERAGADSLSIGAVVGAWDTRWGHVRTDGGYHASFEATELPRVTVGTDWAWPLVVPDRPLRRSLALHVELASPGVGLRRAERSVLGHHGDEAARTKWGFRTGARQVRETEAALSREEELVAGFADARFALVLSVCARSEEALDKACTHVEGQAVQAQVELRRLWGQQAGALAATLPLAHLRLAGGWS